MAKNVQHIGVKRATKEVDMNRPGTWETRILRSIHGPVAEQGIWSIRTNRESRELYNDLDTTAKGKCKAIPLQALTGPEGSRRLRLPDFKTVGT
jgi:hypothetical protein